MPGSDRSLEVVSEWLQKADNDLTTAEHTFGMGPEAPFDTICFHAQQCVEKSLKAVLTRHAIEFGRTHDIEALVRLLPEHLLSDWPLAEQRLLTVYATVTRYPGEYDPISRREARQAVDIATAIRQRIREYLQQL